MSSILISGKEIGQAIRSELSIRIDRLKNRGITPGLAVILVGENSASKTYVANKQKTCEALGMHSRLLSFESELTERELIQAIHSLNNDPEIHGILVQLPLPNHITETEVLAAISPAKDVDGFHPINIGKMMLGQDTFLPCTPFGVMKLLEHSHIEISGKHAVVIGRSHIVGKPMGQLLLQKDATVTYAHSKTANLKEITLQADILVVAVGRTKMITSDYVKTGAVVIDVGMNRDENNRLCGDVDFDSVKEKAAYLTPVPGGVGPMTITMLMVNTVKSAENELLQDI
ncbi:bifunctional methylenetetrahydrofolate dehydrogenase/methenyltetrahydrofolate cyclohydrolase FolD [Paenisporosarcina antarctica]|uniref:Bifunctional protein FolD n=1 Tax=Paenisporosarcina antarctica TaxID=417367 RepID=A0A4P6ZXV5_9BACL|nr:bifunctional methylenetetrahydrofolate dehydrogenase/methenyltetrahydrofolate cyclohydrolase FolD [Paenisporosarcina antarctica]QBP40939.1 bifunctional methylenetetrahydrofolate dehydrogenase/methenyltetrahydrofolate cyclohydrolase FolD [Paenisporosarcina antarctica]